MTPRNEDNAQGSSDEEDSDSSGSNSDVSSEDDSSDVSDLDKFEEAYADFGALTAGVDPRTLERDCSGHTNEEVPGLDLPGGVAACTVDYPTKCSQQAPGKVIGRALHGSLCYEFQPSLCQEVCQGPGGRVCSPFG